MAIWQAVVTVPTKKGSKPEVVLVIEVNGKKSFDAAVKMVNETLKAWKSEHRIKYSDFYDLSSPAIRAKRPGYVFETEKWLRINKLYYKCNMPYSSLWHEELCEQTKKCTLKE
jgi:hypothetical protein